MALHLLGLSVCIDCIMIAANGETSEPFDYEAWNRAVSAKWGEKAYIIPGMEELGFSDKSCDGCGDSLDGLRFVAYVEISPEK